MLGDKKTVNDSFLNACNNSALFLPDTEAYTLFQYFNKKARFKGKLFLSKKPMFSVRTGLSFFRWVNPLVLRRMDGLMMSGILDWWTDFSVKYLPKAAGVRFGEEEEQASEVILGLGGNIVVVFAVFLIGLAVSIVVFPFEYLHIIEMGPKIYRFFSSASIGVKRICQNKWGKFRRLTTDVNN